MSWLDQEIDQDEGFSTKPYFDCCGKFFRLCTCEKQGKLTIGKGRNLEDVGVSLVEANILRDNDLASARQSASVFFWYSALTPARQDVITQMVFNLGFKVFCGFKKTIDAITKRDFKIAAAEMMNSQWSEQVGERASRYAAVMASGEYPKEGSGNG